MTRFSQQVAEMWRREILRLRCMHPDVRCVHGDEIIESGYKRGRCRVCGRYVGDLPEMCAVTGVPHA